jgi:hypothetical protein
MPLCPGDHLGAVAALALVVERCVLLLATVDLGGGGVEVEADRLGRVEPELGVDRVADAGQSGDGGAALDRGERRRS